MLRGKRDRSRMSYQLINSPTGQVQRASRLQLTAIHREAAKKKRVACALPPEFGNAEGAIPASSFRGSVKATAASPYYFVAARQPRRLSTLLTTYSSK